METRAHYALVGFFALALAAAAAVFAIWLSQISFDREFDQYDVVFQGPVRGLTEQSEVRFNGIKVGEVTRLGLDQQDSSIVVAQIRVIAQTPVRSDSTAQLEPQGITGLSYIQISAGSSGEPPARPDGGGLRRIQSEPAQIDSLLEGGSAVVDSSRQALARINLLLDDETIINVRNTIANLSDFSNALMAEDGLGDQISEAVESLNAASIAMEQAGVAVDVVASGDIAVMARETTIASIEVARASEETAEILEAAREPLDRFTNEGLDELTLAIGDLRRLIVALENLTAEIEDDPAAFITNGRRREVEIPQ